MKFRATQIQSAVLQDKHSRHQSRYLASMITYFIKHGRKQKGTDPSDSDNNKPPETSTRCTCRMCRVCVRLPKRIIQFNFFEIVTNHTFIALQ